MHQAEDGTVSQGAVESNHAGYTGTGFVNLDNATGSYVQWTATAPAAGTTSLTIRHANGSSANRPMSVTVNGTVVNAGLAFNPTGAWSAWADASLSITLNAGANIIRVTSTTAYGGPNLDKITLGVAGSPSPTPSTSPPPGGTPVGVNGQLHVCGLKLCNQYDRPIQLRGMSTHGMQWYGQCVNSASLTALATDWTADVLRISMYIQEGGYETDPRGFTDLVHSIIEQVTARGMYAIVDWHQLSPGDPNANLSRAKTFFAEIAQRHKHKVNILYDVANEPNGVSWSTVKSYHEQIIPVIRAQDADSVILLGTHGWGSFGVSDGRGPSDISNNPVNATNIMYTFHFYAGSHGSEYLDALSTGSNSFPVFVTEFGTQTASGDGANNFTRSQQYLDLMATKKISWVNWNYSDDSRSGAVFTSGTCPSGPFTGSSKLKPAGVWIRDHIRTPADDFPTS
ncbi:cellulase family glycosylhydrolase [Micromonospora sp. MW-13]|uniref:cellulase family glycosylhydrolase n=1 Tax=Micromonospora sp. MW-13 TaxID=2094022 RepID=UPI00352EB6B1